MTVSNRSEEEIFKKRVCILMAALGLILLVGGSLIGMFSYAKSHLPSFFGYAFVNESTFPDECFRSRVSENFDRDGDGIIPPGELSDVVRIEFINNETRFSNDGFVVEDVSTASLKEQPFTVSITERHNGERSKITSLKGIQIFSSLRVLDCAGLGLAELDISNNPELMYVDCTNNQFDTLDLSGNRALVSLFCDTGVKLSGLDKRALYYEDLVLDAECDVDSVVDNDGRIDAKYGADGLLRGLCRSEGIGQDVILSGTFMRLVDMEPVKDVACAYDSRGMLVGIEQVESNPKNTIYSYSAAGQLESVKGYSQVQENECDIEYAYDSRSRVTGWRIASSPSMESFAAEKDDRELISGYVHTIGARPDSFECKYDDARRLTKIGRISGGDTETLSDLSYEPAVDRGANDAMWCTEWTEEGVKYCVERDEEGNPISLARLVGPVMDKYVFELDESGNITNIRLDLGVTSETNMAIGIGERSEKISVGYVRHVGKLSERKGKRYTPKLSIAKYPRIAGIEEPEQCFTNEASKLFEATLLLWMPQQTVEYTDTGFLAVNPLASRHDLELAAYDMRYQK